MKPALSRLLAMSFDCPTSPYLTLGKMNQAQEETEQLHGWGFAWYPGQDYAAAVIKDTKTHSGAMVSQVLSDWKRFHSTTFICHLKGAAKRTTQQDTQPFNRTYAGRDWVFCHSGDLNRDYATALPLGDNPTFEPLGITDSEHAFCWLLSQMNQQKVRHLLFPEWKKIHEWLIKINRLGTANLIIGDGLNLIVYHDMNSFNPLYWARHHPPHSQLSFSTGNTQLEIEDHDYLRTFVFVSNHPQFSPLNTPMVPGQMLVIRRGAIVWNSHSHKDNNARTPRIMPSPTMPRITSPTVEQQGDTVIAEKKPSIISAFDNRNRVYNILHQTTYRYVKDVEMSKHALRLHPVHDQQQEVLEYELLLSTPCESDSFDDVFGNKISHVVINNAYRQLTTTLRAKINVKESPIMQHNSLHRPQTIPVSWMPWQQQMMMPYLISIELPETQLIELTDFAMSFAKRNDYNVIDLLNDMNWTIYNDFAYVSGSTSLETTPFEVYTERKGVCQDFANLFICLARLLNIPARYRVGYIYTGSDYENKIQSDASHAWVEVFLPSLGWVGFDPTNGCLANQNHIRIACGRNYFDATPTSGTIYEGGGKESLSVEVRVELAEENISL